MSKRSHLINETTMYSVNHGRVLTHHFPWPSHSEQLEKYTERGFTFERPVEIKSERVISNLDCPTCQRPCKTKAGLLAHMRKHKTKVTEILEIN